METEVDNINDLMKNMSLVKKPITNTELRGKFRDVKVVCNYKKINLNAGKLYMLAINTDPHIDNFYMISTMVRGNGKLIREKIGQHLVQGMNLIASKYLDEDLIIEIPPSPKFNNISYKLKISNTKYKFDFSATVDETFMHQTKVFTEKIINSCLYVNKNLIKFNNKNFFDFTKSKSEGQYNIIPGYSTAITVCSSGPMIRINTKNKIMRTISCYDVIKKLNSKDDIKDHFVNKSILSRYGVNKKVYRVDDIITETNVSNTFIKRRINGEFVDQSLLEYYKQVYSINIEHVDQPLFVMKKKKGEVETIIHLVPELFTPTGMDEESKGTDDFKKNMNKVRAKPSDKMKAFDEFFEYLNKDCKIEGTGLDKKGRKIRNVNEIRDSWGINIDRDFESISCKKLTNPTLYFLNDKEVQADDNGKFRSDKCLDNFCIENWAYICEYEDNNVNNILDTMKKCCDKIGLTIKKPVGFALGKSFEWGNKLKEKKDELKNFSIIVCMLRDNNAKTYKTVKEICLRRLGVYSQCLVMNNHRKNAFSSLTNVLNQMIVKCGGFLYKIKLGDISNSFKRPSVVIGLEVTKSGRDSKKYSFVATLNSSHNKLMAHEEIFEGKECKKALPNFIDKLIASFSKKPELFVFYRTGSNQSQNKVIKDEDIIPLKKHLLRLSDKDPEYKPKCIFILANKMNDAKFFQSDRPSDLNSMQNPKSGVCIDQVVTVSNPDFYEFYIQPQFVNQGTATPSKFTVMLDDTDLKIEEVQLLTYHLCFYYWNWAGAIRVPAVLKCSEVLNKYTASNLEEITLTDKIKQTPFYL